LVVNQHWQSQWHPRGERAAAAALASIAAEIVDHRPNKKYRKADEEQDREDSPEDCLNGRHCVNV
jgi:hypothetical protein